MKLDQEQLKAITSEESTAVIAGPGAGKTRVILNKAQYESNKGLKTLCLTFTRAAAEEIRQRAPRVRASTIHALCYHQLGKFTNDYENLLNEFLELKRKPKFDLVLVDEFQDLTSKELEVVLSVCSSKLFLVGDNNQAIFGYCDAEGGQITKTKIKKVYLSRNYRSSNSIIEKLESLNMRGLVSVHQDGNDKIKNTAILFRTNNQLNLVAYSLRNLGYSFTIRKKGIKYPGEIINNRENEDDNPLHITLSTIHGAKGKEWRNVVTFDWGERLQEKNLMYVATSRASQKFNLVDNLSELINIIGTPKNGI